MYVDSIQFADMYCVYDIDTSGKPKIVHSIPK